MILQRPADGKLAFDSTCGNLAALSTLSLSQPVVIRNMTHSMMTWRVHFLRPVSDARSSTPTDAAAGGAGSDGVTSGDSGSDTSGADEGTAGSDSVALVPTRPRRRGSKAGGRKHRRRSSRLSSLSPARGKQPRKPSVATPTEVAAVVTRLEDQLDVVDATVSTPDRPFRVDTLTGEVGPFASAQFHLSAEPRSQGRVSARAVVRVYAHIDGADGTNADVSSQVVDADKKWIQDLPLDVSSVVRAPDTSGFPPDGTRLRFGSVPVGCIKWIAFTVTNHGMAPDNVVCSAHGAKASSSASRRSAASNADGEPDFVVVPSSCVVDPMSERVIRVGFFPHDVGNARTVLHIVSCGVKRIVRSAYRPVDNNPAHCLCSDTCCVLPLWHRCSCRSRAVARVVVSSWHHLLQCRNSTP